MTLNEWIDSIPEDERDLISTSDGWKAGATAMLEALIERGHIGQRYVEEARLGTADIID